MLTRAQGHDKNTVFTAQGASTWKSNHLHGSLKSQNELDLQERLQNKLVSSTWLDAGYISLSLAT